MAVSLKGSLVATLALSLLVAGATVASPGSTERIRASTPDGCADREEVAPVSLAAVGGGRDPLDPPQALTGYHVSADRSPPEVGANPWNAGPPDGFINVIEIGLAIVQFGHDCNRAAVGRRRPPKPAPSARCAFRLLSCRCIE